MIFVGRSNQPADSWNLNESASTMSIFQQADTFEVHIIFRYFYNTVDGSEIRRKNQLRLVVYPMIYSIYKVSNTTPVGAGFLNLLLMDKILHHQGWWLSHYL